MATGADQPSSSDQSSSFDHPANPPPFVVRSTVRVRHKREFQFASKAHAEAAASLSGRTRPRKAPPAFTSTPSSPPPRCRSISKKRKTSDANNGSRTRGRPPQASGFQPAPSSSKVPTIIIPETDGSQEDLADGSFASTSAAMPNVADHLEAGSTSGRVACEVGPKFRLQPKIPKDVLLKKVPRNIKELLATGLLEGKVVVYRAGLRKRIELKGHVHGSKILCHCSSCKGSNAVSACEFEKHAGSLKKHPADYIYLENNMSIHDVIEALKSAPPNMMEVAIRNAIGPLQTNNTYQKDKECIGLSSKSAEGCFSLYSENRNKSSATVGRRQEISNRCIQNVKKQDIDLGHYDLSRHDNFDPTGPCAVILCEQCDKEYHIECLKDHNICDVKVLLQGAGVVQDLSLRVIKGKIGEDGSTNLSELDTRWRLLSGEASSDDKGRWLKGKTSDDDNELLLSSALSIFHDTFDPDRATGNLFSDMVNGKRDSKYHGMHCAVLTVESYVVSAAILRILGVETAELPLVATSLENRGKGYFRTLFYCIQKFLQSLSITHLVLPAVKETKSMWINKFGFTKIPSVQLQKYTKGNHMIFRETSMLHKQISNLKSSERNSDSLKIHLSLSMKGPGDAANSNVFGMFFQAMYIVSSSIMVVIVNYLIWTENKHLI